MDVAKMEWAKPVRTNFPRCAHTCVPVSFRDSIVAGVVGTVREGDGAGGADGESQEGLVVFGGFSGNQVENSLLFIDKGKPASIVAPRLPNISSVDRLTVRGVTQISTLCRTSAIK